MTFDPTKPCTTRDGRDVIIKFTDGRGDYPIAGYIGAKDGVDHWSKDGHYFGGNSHALDLVNVPETPRCEPVDKAKGGFHWVENSLGYSRRVWEWASYECWYCPGIGGKLTVDLATQDGWKYLGPVAPFERRQGERRALNLNFHVAPHRRVKERRLADHGTVVTGTGSAFDQTWRDGASELFELVSDISLADSLRSAEHLISEGDGKGRRHLWSPKYLRRVFLELQHRRRFSK